MTVADQLIMEGMQKGREEEKIQTAKKFLNSNELSGNFNCSQSTCVIPAKAGIQECRFYKIYDNIIILHIKSSNF